MSLSDTLLSFFGEECWPYVIGDCVITSVKLVPAVGFGVSGRITVHLKCGKLISIIRFHNFGVGKGSDLWTAEMSTGVPREIRKHSTLSGLFDYLSS